MDAPLDVKADSVDSDTEIPVFSCKVTLVGDQITITPDLQKFEDGFQHLLSKLNESVESVPVLFDDIGIPRSWPIIGIQKLRPTLKRPTFRYFQTMIMDNMKLQNS